MVKKGAPTTLMFDFCRTVPLTSEVQDAIKELAEAEGADRGAIFTRREVVDLILDLVSYSPSQRLFEMRLLEPCFGSGDFLFPAIDRLFDSVCQHKVLPTFGILADAITAVELHRESYETVRSKLRDYLINKGLARSDASRLTDSWLVQGDFLLTPLSGQFTHVVGNPPYLRQESIPDILLNLYRERYSTLYDRADLYVPFFEHCLSHLAEHGVLGFICTDRWMRNKYGGPLRRMVADGYHLRAVVDMIDTAAFHADVATYPAITIIARESGKITRVAKRPANADAATLGHLSAALEADELPGDGNIEEYEAVAMGTEPWLLGASENLALVRRLEREFPTLESAGCKVGIGVATGADKIYIAPSDRLPVEDCRKLPLVTTKDIVGGEIQWTGKWVLNPYEADGSLADLAEYPRFAQYVESHREAILGRTTAKNNPKGWYKTIDRIYPELASVPKLLIPDIKSDAVILYEAGSYYPHHNLYYIISKGWDLLALKAVLDSGIAKLFVAAYSPELRGGTLRFQAQYLRRIRVPWWDSIDPEVKMALTTAGRERDQHRARKLVKQIYGLSEVEAAILT